MARSRLRALGAVHEVARALFEKIFGLAVCTFFVRRRALCVPKLFAAPFDPRFIAFRKPNCLAT